MLQALNDYVHDLPPSVSLTFSTIILIVLCWRTYRDR